MSVCSFFPCATWSSCLAVSGRCQKHSCFSIRMSSSLLRCLLLMVVSVERNPTMIRVTLLCGRACLVREGPLGALSGFTWLREGGEFYDWKAIQRRCSGGRGGTHRNRHRNVHANVAPSLATQPAPYSSLPVPPGPESWKSLQRVSRGGVQKVSETVSKQSLESQNGLFRDCFGHSLDPGAGRPGRLFGGRLFRDSGPGRPRRLL